MAAADNAASHKDEDTTQAKDTKVQFINSLLSNLYSLLLQHCNCSSTFLKIRNMVVPLVYFKLLLIISLVQ